MFTYGRAPHAMPST